MTAETPAGEPQRDAGDGEARPAAGARPAGKSPQPKPGHLPMTELLFDKQGPASPFGEDIQFPLPPETLPYTHPGQER